MKLIKTIGILIVSILLQILLLPFRAISFLFKIIETICKIIKNTINHFVIEVKKEVLINQKLTNNGKENSRKERKN